MKEIPLTKGHVALVDDEDHEWLSRLKWCWCNGYAVSSTKGKKFKQLFGHLGIKTTQVKMHRLILRATPEQEVDHEHGNTLDNRRSEIRIVTDLQNHQNCTSRVGRSRFKGVSWSRVCRSWHAAIMANRKRHHLGYHTDEEAAARAYDTAAIQLHGEFARLNFPKDTHDLARIK